MTGIQDLVGVRGETRLDSLCEAVPSGLLPDHIAFIMDGNGRWARARGLPRPAGHRAGAMAAQRAVEACLEKGIPFATFFALSTENWRRPAAEIGGILRLLRERLDAVRKSIPDGVRIRFVGDHSRLDRSLRRRMQDVEERTRSGTRMLVSIAIGYGGRNDIVAAARSLAERAALGEISPGDIDESLFFPRRWRRMVLRIRTWSFALAGSTGCRISCYGSRHIPEFVSLDCYWPDFDALALGDALREFAARERRFGGTGSP